MTGIKVVILEFTDDSQPGWVRCTFKDAYGQDHFFVEKIPIVTREFPDETSAYPLEGIIHCIIVEKENHGEEIDPDTVTIHTDLPFGICSEDNQTIFHVFKHQLTEE